MPETDKKQLKRFEFRASLPKYFRYAALGALVLTILMVVIGFYRSRNNPEFRMKGFPTALSKDVIAEINGYERRETEGNVVKYYIKADKAITFTDNHQELENVYLQVFGSEGNYDQITAAKAVYVPEEDKNFTAYFAGNVQIDTRDRLKVRTEQITYKKADETAAADEQIDFERESVKGRSSSALVHIPQKLVELFKNVEIETFRSPEAGASNVKNGTLKAEYASYDQLNEKADLKNDVQITADLANGRANAKAARGTVYLVENVPDGRDLNRFELFDNVEINSEQEGQAPTQINAGYAQYEKTADRFDLKNDVHILVADRSKPVDIRAGSAVYEQKTGKVMLDGSAQVTQGPESISGEHIYTELYPSRSIKYSKVTGGARLKQTADDRITEVQANELNATFDGEQTLTGANAVGSSTITLVPTRPNEYTKVTMTAPNKIGARFKGRGAIDKIETDGRTTIALDAPDGSADAANKRVTADTVRTSFDQAGKNISRAEAIGSAELAVEPRHPADSTYSTLVTAPKFDCTFFPTGNNAKLCVASSKAKAVRTPSVAGSPRGKQTLSADTLQASFNQQTKDVEQFDASGSAKFTEKDRNAIAGDISFRPVDSIVKLRGGEPTVWDSSARAKAAEINWDTRAEKSSMSGGVSTTYYSQRQSGGATPFGQSEKPVFVTASQAEFDHRAESAVFEGNARGWQENNYVRADKFLIQQREGRFFAEGNVQSLLYNAKRKENGKETTVPVYAASQKMQYDRDGHVLKYDTSVDLRQGTDRISAGSATISLSPGGDVEKTLVENNVVITQPGRKAQGDFAQFLASDESVTLRGSPARVEDAQNGSSQGAQLTMYLRDNKIESEGRTNQNSSGRTRSVYKVNNN